MPHEKRREHHHPGDRHHGHPDHPDHPRKHHDKDRDKDRDRDLLTPLVNTASDVPSVSSLLTPLVIVNTPADAGVPQTSLPPAAVPAFGFQNGVADGAGAEPNPAADGGVGNADAGRQPANPVGPRDAGGAVADANSSSFFLDRFLDWFDKQTSASADPSSGSTAGLVPPSPRRSVPERKKPVLREFGDPQQAPSEETSGWSIQGFLDALDYSGTRDAARR
jgi:hypothetical protein